MTDKRKHYVDNEAFFKEIKKWKQRVLDNREMDDPDPPSTEFMGECFLRISEHLVMRPNFINYTFRDDLVSDGIENCLQYIENFKEEKSSNAFAYVTQIIYFAFLRRIHKEKKQAAIKQRSIEQAGVMFDTFDTMDGNTTGMNNSYVDFLQENMNPINYKPRGSKKKKVDK